MSIAFVSLLTLSEILHEIQTTSGVYEYKNKHAFDKGYNNNVHCY